MVLYRIPDLKFDVLVFDVKYLRSEFYSNRRVVLYFEFPFHKLQ